MKKWIVSILVIIIFCGIRFVDPWFLDMVRMKALDQHQITQQESTIEKIVTVEIDNESIRERGQWPWPRNELAKDIERLYRMGDLSWIIPTVIFLP